MVIHMKIWINKCIEKEKSTYFNDALTFNLNVPGKGGLIASNIRDGWYRKLGIQSVSPICEDLYILALSVFAADKRISRSFSSDGWTRKLHLSIPVIEYSHWNSVRTSLEKMLSFLSGDIWTIDFRECEPTNRYQDNHKRPPQKLVSLETYDAVSLLSGGLDSYCGAYELLSQGKNVIFVGFKEFGKLEQIQNEIVHHFNESFPETSKMLFTFTAKAYKPLGIEKLPAENTSRSRSFLFLAAAICVAEAIGVNKPVYIPENGFIGLNLPLTPGRKGSCSTRTTHPYFLKMLNQLFLQLGISHKIINPYAFRTKREMIQEHKDTKGFLDCVSKTISCSHPCNTRWHGKSQPENCGYCYPCLIRQSSLLDVIVPNEHYTFNALSYDYILSATDSRRSDLVDLLSSISAAVKSTDQALLKRIKQTGQLSKEESLAFLRLYKATISDLLELFSRDKDLMRMIGIEYASN